MGKYLMWGVFPVYIDQEGAWKPAAKSSWSKAAIHCCIVTLALLNRCVEKMFMGKIEMNIPILPAKACEKELERAYD